MNQELATHAHTVAQAIAACRVDLAGAYLKLGALLSAAKQAQLWEVEGLKNFAEYVTNHGLARAWAYQCVGVWERFGERGRGIIPERMRVLLPLKLTPEAEAEMLEAARELPAGAFHDQVQNLRGRVGTDECEHLERVQKCVRCGKVFE